MFDNRAMTALLVALFFVLVAGSAVTIGRLVVPSTQREPMLSDMGAAFLRGMKALDSISGTYISDRAARR
jgi:hypothetical protein